MRFKKKLRKRNIQLFDIILVITFVILALITLYPFYYVVIMSLANSISTAKHVPYLLPYVLDFTGYKIIFKDIAFYKAFGVSIFVTIVGTSINMIMSVTGAYVLSKKDLIGRRAFLSLILFTMLFSGGLIPGYINIKNLHLIDSIWVMIIPSAVSTYYMIIMKNYFLSLPASLEEAAKIDGANALTVLIKIVLPISKPFIATFALFYSVEHWNEWYNALLYISVEGKQPLQIYLREVLVSMNQQLSIQAQAMVGKTQKVLNSTIQMSCIVITMVPILCIYPKVQKHFVKGIMVGGLKE